MVKKIIFFILLSIYAYSSNYDDSLKLPNETLYFSMTVEENETISLVGDSSYVVYRYGSPEEILMTFPQLSKSDKDKFYISYVDFEGNDNYYLEFSTKEYDYRIYEESFGEEKNTGIIIKNKNTGQTIEFSAYGNSIKGSLKNLLNNKNIIKK